MKKSKISTSFFWSFVNTGGSQILALLFSITLARILVPDDFGVIAIVVSFTLIANIFVDSGFSQALIRHQNVTTEEYDSVFLFSFAMGLLSATILFSSSKMIATYFSEPRMVEIIRVMSISPIIYSLMTINNTIIIKQLQFKLRAKLTLISSMISGFIGLSLALMDFGVWSLVSMQLGNITLLMSLMWFRVEWRPGYRFRMAALNKHLRFGLIISISNLANVLSTKSFVLILGKYFTIADASYFSRAESLRNLPTKISSKVISKVTYPTLSKINSDIDLIRSTTRDIIRYTAIITVPIILGIGCIANELVVVLLGEIWLPAGSILTYLCFAGVFVPLDAINMNLIKSHGDIRIYLAIEVLKICMMACILILGIFYGMNFMLTLLIFCWMLIYIITSYLSGKIISYSLQDYLIDILQPMSTSLAMFVLVTIFKEFVNLSHIAELLLSILLGISIVVLILEILKNKEYFNLKDWLIGN